MRIHTKLDYDDITDALLNVQTEGRVSKSVHIDTLSAHRSSYAPHAFEVKLASNDSTRRRTNSGQYGAGYDHAATHDEWGWFLAELYKHDMNMLVGTPKNPIYHSAQHFDRQTALSYNPVMLLSFLTDDDSSYDPYPYVLSTRYGAKQGFIDGYRTTRGHNSKAYRPRTREQIIERLTDAERAKLESTGLLFDA